MIFVTFSLNGIHYALDIVCVEEVIPLPEITPVENLPLSFRGMINLRGFSLPIMDLRTRLGLEPRPDALETDIIVIKMGQQLTGLIVDKVLEVCEINDEQRLPPPKVSDYIETPYITGVAQLGMAFVFIMQLDQILNLEKKKTFANLDFKMSER
ncbi:hypothetical protein MNBD_NITROSPIRAE01-1142 [hydrothermal vent metagenome]|uniref:CheW-like domain-containing protein n=1 Tax=hydrothermal vent metagenome TaxID=652676 RepID=A0A3B1D9P0_9ZZZZ